jgi:hypothetical protein
MDALPSDEAMVVAAPPALRRGSFVIAMVVAISLLYRNVTRAGALKLPRRSYRPRAWSERGKVTWEQIRAAAPPPTAPFALVFWTTSWLAYGLMAYYATRVATWTVLGLVLVMVRIFRVVGNMRGALGTGLMSGRGMNGGSVGSEISELITSTVAKVAPKLAGRVDAGALEKMTMQVLGSKSAPNIIATGIQMISKDGIIPKVAEILFAPIKAMVSEAKAASKRDLLTCLKWTTRLAPVYVGGATLSVARGAIANRRSMRVIELNPVDPLVCAKKA